MVYACLDAVARYYGLTAANIIAHNKHIDHVFIEGFAWYATHNALRVIVGS